MSWSGWKDDLAGIKQYEIQVSKLTTYGEKLGYRTQTPVSIETVESDVQQYTVNLAEPGVVIITVTTTYIMHNKQYPFLHFE